ncbi:AraC family transcriptional regulator [Pseudaestuariivita sp.]|uniref:AraC family transcriptional regulator n=1 Tax=Pseudaestuariivita sp. TaxID=2211669 RepID=UPI0040581B3B
MKTRRFVIESYLAPGDAFHIARKDLDARRPAFAHTHNYFELFLIERGATRHRINGRSETLERGALVFVRPEDRHAFQASHAAGCRIFNVMFRTSTAAHLEARYGSELGQRFFWSLAAAPDTYQLAGLGLERALSATTDLMQAPQSLAGIEQYLLYMMSRVIDHTSRAAEDVPRWLAAACHAARAPDVFQKGAAGFVEAAGRGHAHVCRATRKHYGVSPTTLVNRIRMEHAAQHLGTTDLPISEIALTCGIENISHFYKLFREAYGHTPRQYRKQHQMDPVQPVLAP